MIELKCSQLKTIKITFKNMKTNLLDYLITRSDFSKTKFQASPLRKVAIELLLVSCTFYASIVPYGQSQALAGETSTKVKNFQVTFNPPAGDRPQTSTGGASRSIGQCINQAENADLPLAPLLPASAKGLTVASHPTVLAYLPETAANKVFFSWQDENNNDHYQNILPIENQGGIISLTLPEDAPPLEIGKNYQWAIAVMCDGRLQPDSPMIVGQIQRVAIESTLSDRLNNASALETAAIYGEAGIWYETVAILAQLKITQPNNPSLASNWQELLTSVELEKFATTPLVN